MITIKYQHGGGVIEAFGRAISASCDVRNEENGRRLANQVEYTIPDGKPYQPRRFPKGIWKIGRPLAREDKYKAPFYIPTDAFREVQVWSVKEEYDEISKKKIAKYSKPTKEKVIDRGYGLHFSVSPTTLGCIRITKKDDLLFMVDEINKLLDDGMEIFLEVS